MNVILKVCKGDSTRSTSRKFRLQSLASPVTISFLSFRKGLLPKTLGRQQTKLTCGLSSSKAACLILTSKAVCLILTWTEFDDLFPQLPSQLSPTAAFASWNQCIWIFWKLKDTNKKYATKLWSKLSKYLHYSEHILFPWCIVKESLIFGGRGVNEHSIWLTV